MPRNFSGSKGAVRLNFFCRPPSPSIAFSAFPKSNHRILSSNFFYQAYPSFFFFFSKFLERFPSTTTSSFCPFHFLQQLDFLIPGAKHHPNLHNGSPYARRRLWLGGSSWRDPHSRRLRVPCYRKSTLLELLNSLVRRQWRSNGLH